MNNLMLRLFDNGDIDIIEDDFYILGAYRVVYHKTYNLGENLQENLILAYEEWKKMQEDKSESK